MKYEIRFYHKKKLLTFERYYTIVVNKQQYKTRGQQYEKF